MIWSYKNGEKLPRMGTALRMASVFNVSIEWLLQGKTTIISDNVTAYNSSQADQATQNILAFIKQLSPTERKQALEILRAAFPED